MSDKPKKKKLNSRWRKGADRAPTADEKRYIFDRCYEKPGWHHGAKVYARSKLDTRMI